MPPEAPFTSERPKIPRLAVVVTAVIWSSSFRMERAGRPHDGFRLSGSTRRVKIESGASICRLGAGAGHGDTYGMERASRKPG